MFDYNWIIIEIFYYKFNHETIQMIPNHSIDMNFVRYEQISLFQVSRLISGAFK